MKIVFFLVLIPFFLFSQNDLEVDRKGQLLFSLGAEYRITPIYKVDLSTFSDGGFYTNIDKQNSGISGHIGLEWFMLDNISFEFEGSLRHDLLVNKPPTAFNDFEQEEAEKKLMIGYHLGLNYYFQVFKKGEVFIGGGISLLNRNSNYETEQVFFDQQGNITGTETRAGDYKFTAFKTFIGYKLNKNRISLGVYIAKNTPYFEGSTTFIIPNISYKYTFAKQ